MASKTTKMTTTSTDGGDEQSGRAEEVAGQDADHGRRDQLADQHQQQDRVEELLGRLGQAHERLGAAATLVAQGARARDLFMRTSDVSAMAKKPERTSSTHDRHDQVGVAGRPGRRRSRDAAR